MVMIIFKSAGQKPDGLELTLSAIGEETGRILLRDYTNQQEDLYLEAADFDDDVICRIALGAELEDYRFDKYAKLAPQDYPKLETITFKVKNPLEMRLKYEPYAALANAIRFARDLFNEPESLYQTEQYFFEIKRLEYLNLYFKDLGDGLVMLEWKAESSSCEPLVLVAKNRKATAVGAGLMKAVALQRLPLSIRAYLKIEGELDDFLIPHPIFIKPDLLTDEEAAKELRKLYEHIKGEL